MSDADKSYRERKRVKRNRKRFIDGKLVSILDAMGLTDRQSVRVICAVAQALGHSLDDLVVSRRTIERARKRNRKEN